jgi:hypothetical protein
MSFEKILFGALISSPIIAIIFLIARISSSKKPVGNDAPYYSFWFFVLILGFAFDFFSYLNGQLSGDYRIGFATTWNFVANLNLWFVKVPFIAISIFSLTDAGNIRPFKGGEECVARSEQVLLQSGGLPCHDLWYDGILDRFFNNTQNDDSCGLLSKIPKESINRCFG